ncbi:hypothetical protein LZ654_18420 [Lelliottia amnigena]|uniref:hypothetical protein n=1 Tax=Lelliottia amnigena TaxID=61646 RepID=UPI001F36D46F|nr:hypothetical protein [Lelliottia amnigena]MCE9966799.1 hypothetical protein [Lelliottia amnigena]
MSSLISLVAFVLFVAFIIGLIKPSLVKMPNRKRSSAFFLGGFLALVVLNTVLVSSDDSQQIVKNDTAEVPVEPVEKAFDFGDMSLKEYRNEPKDTRHKIVSNYVEFKGIPASWDEGFYACMSEFTFSKDGELELKAVLGWCFNDYEREPKSLSTKINLDNFQGNFSGWDGSYRPLEKIIKANMNNDSSYKHVSTTYHLILNKDPHAIVKTTFRGTNAYGGVVKETIAARINVRTGEIISIVND